jgi:hypothetical protein
MSGRFSMATENRQKRVRLTCECGMSYSLNTIHDLRRRCANGRCHATLNINEMQLWKYKESIIALMETLGLRRDYVKQLNFAKRMSKKFLSPYTIDIVEIP